MKWIVEWGTKHEDEPDIVDVSGLPNLGITSLDVPKWDKKFINRMTRDEMKMALRDCSRLNFQVKNLDKRTDLVIATHLSSR